MSPDAEESSGPYKGLAPFGDSELDALLFFGREREREIVVANLIAARLTVLYGPSGVGKSSLLCASVARALRGLPERPVVVVFSSWTENPSVGLAAAVAGLAGVADAETLREGVAAVGERDIYLILDQAEEYFLYHGEGEQAFEDDLVYAVTEPVRVNVLLSLREDALAKLDRFKGRIPNLFGNSLRLDRLDRAAGHAAIVRPIERWNELHGTTVEVDASLVHAVLDSVGAGQIEQGLGGRGSVEPDSRPVGIEAPFLQLVMHRLWQVESGRPDHRLRLGTLNQLGGAGRIVADHLELAIDELRPFQKDIAAELSRYLVTPSGTKISHTLADLAGYAGISEENLAPVATELSERRILRSLESEGELRYEIFHDVLADAVLRWRTRYQAQRQLEQERVAAHKRHRRLLVLVGATTVAVLALAVLTVWALTERRYARAKTILVHARELDANALTKLRLDPELSLLLAVQAARIDPTPQVEDALRDALMTSRVRWVATVGSPVVAATFSADGTKILVASADGKVRIYAGREHRLLRTLDHGGPIRTSAFAPNGRLVVTAGDDGAARIWDVGTGRLLQAVGQGAPIVGAVFSGDGSLLVTAGAHAAKVWRVSDGHLLHPFRATKPVSAISVNDARGRLAVVVGNRVEAYRIADGKHVGTFDQGAPVTGAAFSPDGRFLATAGRNRVAMIWHVSSGQRVQELSGQFLGLTTLAFGPQGGRVATASRDGTARVWDVRTGEPVAQLMGHSNPIVDVAFSPDGNFVATASTDNTGAVWRAEGGARVVVLAGDDDAVRSVVFSPNGRTVLSGSDSGAARLWDAGTQEDLVRVRSDPPPAPSIRAQSRDGVVATASGDVVELSGRGAPQILKGHHAAVTSVAFSPDGARLLTASRDHDARLWNVETGALIHTLRKHLGPVTDARFSPDGRWIVTAGPAAVGLWSATGEFIRNLHGPTTLITAVAFLRDSRTIVSSERNGRVRAYKCLICGTIPELLELAEQRLAGTGRELTADERKRYSD
jgi:WD40 repeat protein